MLGSAGGGAIPPAREFTLHKDGMRAPLVTRAGCYLCFSFRVFLKTSKCSLRSFQGLSVLARIILNNLCGLWVSVVEFGSTFQRKNLQSRVPIKNFRWRIYPERLSLLSRIGLKKQGFFPGTELAAN
jgi:hypothetical protein